jgi:hypothetical protein
MNSGARIAEFAIAEPEVFRVLPVNFEMERPLV